MDFLALSYFSPNFQINLVLQNMKQNTLINQQFGATANAYLSSSVHAQGADLQRLSALATQLNSPFCLDLGCGAGHASFALAEGGAKVISYDLTAEMLEVVKTESLKRGINDLQVQQGPAEKLPFDNESFDLVTTRFSAHHWSNINAALREIKRVLKTRGTLIVIDVISPETPLFDTLLQSAEILRDASHVRDYRLSEWSEMLQAAGFKLPNTDQWKLTMEFASWVARMRTSELRVQTIRDLLEKASTEATTYFSIQKDFSFDIDVAWIETTIKT